jgi:exopolysaccharide biosynthesis polyprenyl glycosylphosphotransferase
MQAEHTASSESEACAPEGSMTRPIARSARNAAILRAARDVLLATIVARRREAAIRAVEDAVDREAARSLPRALFASLRQVGVLIAATDICATLGAWWAAGPSLRAAPISMCALVVVMIGARSHLYCSRLDVSVLDDLPACLLQAVTAVGPAAGCTVALGIPAADGPSYLRLAVLLFGFLALARAAAYAMVRHLRRSRRVAHPTLIVGNGAVGQRLAGAMLEHPEYGLSPAGFIDDDTGDAAGASVLPTLGGLAALPRARAGWRAHAVVFAFSREPDAHLVRAVRACARMNLQVFVVPRYFELLGANRHAHIETLWGVPLIRLRRWPLGTVSTFVKRLFDIVLAAFSLVLLSPVLGLCALAVRLESGPGVLFRQVRVGRDGKPFVLYKFCSMRPHGDQGDRRWSIDGDAAVGPVGRFLRRTSLDELPQLVNVLRGDMSIVGPRPERPYFAQTFARFVYRYGDRHRLPGGLTGLAQVNGLRGDTSIQDRVMFDNHYIDHWSLWTDIKIMLRTLPAMVRRTRPAVSVYASRGARSARRRA